MSHHSRFDITIVGAGFAGLILARRLRASGRSVVVVDRSRHPRFAFGESSTPLAAMLLERVASLPLADLCDLATWGRWRRAHPGLRVGLKRGFTFYHHGSSGFRNGEENEARLLVAASPDDEIADVQHHRADVDAELARRARAEGVVVWEGVRIGEIEAGAEGVRIRVELEGGSEVLESKWVVDASGPGAVVARSVGARRVDPRLTGGFLGAHLEGVPELSELSGAWFGDAPYPEERAAVHHLFEDGWMWVLRFDHGVESVGLVLDRGPSLDALEVGRPVDEIVALALRSAPELAVAIGRARVVEPWRVAARGSHRLDRAVGESWLTLPSTFAFADPMFSTGLAWSLLGVERVAAVIAGELPPLDYQRRLEREADRIASLIRAARATRSCFEAFVATTWAYFVTVSWAEVGSRIGIGVGELDRDVGFLGVGDEVSDRVFDGDRGSHPPWRGLELEARALEAKGFPVREVERYRQRLRELLAPRDLIGIIEAGRRNLHPADLEVLVSRAHLLGIGTETMRRLLPRLRGLHSPFPLPSSHSPDC